MDYKRITQIIDKFQFNADFLSIADESIADKSITDKSITGESIQGKIEGRVIVNYPSAGVVLPAILCDVLKNECGENLNIITEKVTDIKCDGKRWQCMHDDDLLKENEVLIIANGTRINDLGLSLEFPVEPIRGQVVELNENKASKIIKKILNADVHITPAINRMHYLGATYTKNCETIEVSSDDNSWLLQSLGKMYPGVFKEDDISNSWVGFRTMSKDRVPIVGAIPDEGFFNKEYADICHGNTTKTYPSARYLKGLYISAAHGSRGFTSSFISAEIIASQIAGEPSPVNKKILDYLSPSRFIVNNLKRR